MCGLSRQPTPEFALPTAKLRALVIFVAQAETGSRLFRITCHLATETAGACFSHIHVSENLLCFNLRLL